ncbi:MAG: phosphatase PAP2 family protein [Gammaproteobacteria bacterium]|nr:phosphatase PAP2 family protein [Gammaproteobacteria bacterium]
MLILFDKFSVDIIFQDLLFDFDRNKWILDRSDKLTSLIFYGGAKNAIIIFVLLVALALALSRKIGILSEYKQGLVIVLLSCLTIPAVVSELKSITNIPCPRHIAHYNGSYPDSTLLQRSAAGLPPGKKVECFPAGHASGGFALLSLYFLFKRQRNRVIALTFAMVTGWSMGMYKTVIGDHFISHTVATMILAWMIVISVESAVRRVFAGTETVAATKAGEVDI